MSQQTEGVFTAAVVFLFFLFVWLVRQRCGRSEVRSQSVFVCAAVDQGGARERNVNRADLNLLISDRL